MTLSELKTTREVLAETGIPETTVQDVVRRGLISPAPEVRGGMRFWTPAAVRALRRLVAERAKSRGTPRVAVRDALSRPRSWA